jgi:hypothetical protein
MVSVKANLDMKTEHTRATAEQKDFRIDQISADRPSKSSTHTIFERDCHPTRTCTNIQRVTDGNEIDANLKQLKLVVYEKFLVKQC